MTRSAPNSRDHRIDILRGVSILLVLILHFHLAYNLVESPFSRILSSTFVEALARNGNYGVTIFFVISGYLITSTSLRRFGSLKDVSPPQFYAYRFARIVPCMVLALTIITTLGVAGLPHFRSKGPTSFFIADLSVLTFWHNVLMAKVGYFNYGLNILWSLSVEEVFYFTFPLLCVILRRPSWIVAAWIAAMVYGPIYRYRHADDEIRFLYGYFACFDAIAMGCCMALLARWWKTRRTYLSGTGRNVLQFLAAVLIAWIYLRKAIGDSPVFGPTLVAIGASIFVLVEGCWPGPPTALSRIRWEPMGWLGRHSYELYLFHIVVLALMRNLVDRGHLAPGQKPLWFVVFLVLSTFAAAAVARFYSEPLNRRLRLALIPAK